MNRRRGAAMLIVVVVLAVVGARMVSELRTLPDELRSGKRMQQRLQARLIARSAFERAQRQWSSGKMPTKTWELPQGTFPVQTWNARVAVEVSRGDESPVCRIRVVLRDGETTLIALQPEYPLSPRRVSAIPRNRKSRSL